MAPFSEGKELYRKLKISPDGDFMQKSSVLSTERPKTKKRLPGEPRLELGETRITTVGYIFDRLPFRYMMSLKAHQVKTLI